TSELEQATATEDRQRPRNHAVRGWKRIENLLIEALPGIVAASLFVTGLEAVRVGGEAQGGSMMGEWRSGNPVSRASRRAIHPLMGARSRRAPAHAPSPRRGRP